MGGISAFHGSNTEITSCEVQNSRVSGSGLYAYVGGIAGRSDRASSISLSSVKSGSLIEGTGYDCSVGGIGGCYLAVTNSYLDGSTVIGNGNSFRIGGICGSGNVITKCYVKDSDISETSTSYSGNVGGISGYNEKNITSCYLLNSNVTGSGNGSDDYVGGICGYLHHSSGDVPIVSSCYVIEDANHSVSKTNSTGEGKLGYLVGCRNTKSDEAEDAIIKDCFYNGTGTLVGYKQYNDPERPETNCYGGINSLSAFTTDNSNPRAWSDGAWSDYKEINSTNWPPKLDWEQ